MRKVINVITLIVMVSVNLIDPFVYAISSGDNFGEIQIIDELKQEDDNFDDEELVDEEENNEILVEDQEDEENGDIDEDNEDETDENNFSGEGSEDVDDENGVGTGTEVGFIENGLEELTGDIENLTGDIKDLSGGVEILSGDIEELSGEIVELTGIDLELATAWETLNVEPIVKFELYNDVIVNVEAPVGTFPEGTYVNVRPIISESRLDEIKDQIIGEDGTVSEDSEIVAFDIKFLYKLSDDIQVEVQPKGNTVKVEFNYENNKKLSDADTNEEQEIKVFHIEDKDNDGKKVVQGEEEVKEVTNKVKSVEDGIVVADAESFSVYAVVTTTINGVQVTYNLNGGYWTESGTTETLDRVVTYSYNSTTKTYISSNYYKTPSKTPTGQTGWMFDGWYTDEGCSVKWNGSVNGNMTVYAGWLPFQDLYTYFLIDDYNIINKTIMDRNMGAEEIYSQNFSRQNAKSKGKYYQRGNNYGFGTTIPSADKLTSNVPSAIWILGVPSKYYSNKYRSQNKETWAIGNAVGLWGGVGDTFENDVGDEESRQGPCPDGYHVPSGVSWRELFEGWNQIYNYPYTRSKDSPNISDIRTGLGVDLLLPPAGRWGGDKLEFTESDLSYWASSQRQDTKHAYGFYIGQYGIQPDGLEFPEKSDAGDFIGRARSIRCFKNSETSYLGNIIDLGGGTGGIITIVDGKVKALRKPTRGIDIFGGWYTNDEYLGEPIDSVGDIVPEGTDLYAKWDCPDGYVDDGDGCVKGFKISFNASHNGGTTDVEDIVITGGIVSKTINLADYTAEKDGYYFVGWNTDAGASTGLQGEQTFTQNTKLYAIFLKLYTYRFEDVSGNFLGTGYYESGVVMNMTKLIPLSYYTGGKTADISLYEDLFTLGLTPEEKLTHGIKWTPELPEQGIATEDLVIIGEKLEAFDVRFLNHDGLSDFLRYRVVSGTILQDPETYPREPGLQFEGWYTDNSYSTEFEFPVNITTDVVIYSKFIDVYCSFTTSEVGTTGLKITGFSGTQTEECLTNFVIPSEIGGKTVLEIGDNAFKGDKSGAQIITGEIILPNTITTIGSYAFYKNDISGELKLPNSLITIKSNAFNNNTIGGYLVIPDNVTSIGESAFKNRNQITGLKLGNSVTSIGNQAFYDNKIEGVLEIPNTVTTIGDSVFYNNKIEGVLEIPNSVTSIGNNAFQKNSQITGLKLGNSVITIGNSAFNGCKIEGKLEIPNTVTTIGDSAFLDNNLTGLKLGNSVTTINANAFKNNKIEGKLEIPDSVTTIKGNAFFNNNISGTLTIPGRINNGVVNDAFKCNTIEKVIFGEGITTINDYAFNTVGCETKRTIKSVIFPDSLTTIGDQTFLNQSIEGEFEFTSGLTYLGIGAFKGNKISGTLTVPGRLNDGRLNGAFKCNLIENLIIEEGITVVGDQAFYDNNKDGRCPASKYTIKNVQFPSTLIEIQYNAFRNHQLSSLKLPENVEIIQYNAFDNQHDASGYTLKSVELNDKLQQIQTRAFATNDIKSVYIPDSVENLSGEAFDQLSANIGTYVTGYVTTKKSTLNYTGAYIKPLYQLYTYTFVDAGGNILGTGYYPEILESNTTKVIPLNYYNGIGNLEDFTGVDSLIPHNPGEFVIWTTPLSEHDIVTGNLIVTGSRSTVLHTVMFKNPFTGDIVKYVENNEKVEKPEEYVVEGYTFTGWYNGDVKFDFDTLITSDLILTGVYLPNEYSVLTGTNDETQGTVSVTPGPYTYGKRLELIATPNIGYILERWQLNGKYVMTGNNQYWTGNLVIDQLTGDVVVTGHFAPKDGIQYLIKYRKENIYDSGYDDIYTEVFTGYGRTDSEVVVEERTYPGFILSGNISDYQGVKIAGDGSTVVNVYYKRRSYTINFDSNGGSYVTGIIARYGIHLDKPEDPKKDGYIFSGWIPSFPSEMPLNGADLVADWIDNRTVDYTIKYWKENLNDSGYTEMVSDEKSMTGKVNTDAEIVLRPYLGFVLSGDVSDYQTKIAGDGSTVINLYYNRIKYTVSAGSSDENKGTVIYTGSGSEKYEKMVLFTKQEKPGFKFEKWMLNGQVITGENNEYWTGNLKVKVIDNINVIGYFIPEIYTVSVVSNNTDFGTVSPEILTGYYLANISIVDNVFTVSGSSSIATPKQNTEEYTYTFSGWTNNCGNTLSGNCTVIANFDRTKNSYDITFVSNSGSTVDPQRKEYGEKVDKPADPIRTGYGFSGWFYTGLETKFDFENEIVTGDIILYAKWTPIVYSINYNLNGGVLSGGVSNPLSYTIESGDIILNNPERVGYNFIGWTGTDIQGYSGTVKILSGSIGNREYTANWEARNDIDVTINYYFQDLNKDENKLITGSYSLSGTTKIQGTSDDEIILSNYSGSFDGYTYEYGKVLGEIVTTTTVSPDGSRIIDLYYTRNTYQFTLITDEGSITEGTSPIGDYYYGAKIILSGDKDGDCFVWDEWKTQGIILENNMNHTSFDMPANNVLVESLVIEKTYNIIFDGNGETSGEMEMISGVRCTQPVTLTLNTFVKSGHTFTGWSEIPDGEKKYEDGETVTTLTTGGNITLYARWDINYYLVTWNNYNGELLDKQLLPYGTIPEYIGSISPSRESDAQYSYGFSGWIPGYTKVEGPQVYTADYSTTLNEYTIIWSVDGVETSEVYKYGDNPKFSGSVHKDPTAQYTYTFSGWNPSISVVTTGAKYTATYKQKLREYKVTWVNYNGDVLEIDENVQYGTMPSYNGDTPVRTGDTQQTYTFIGWEPTLTGVVKDTTYEAVFSGNLNTFTIIWENYDGESLETDLDVPYGTMPSYDGDTPTKPSDAEYDYEFTGWSPATGTVVSNQIYKATYTPKLRTYTVRWLNSDKTVLETDENVQYGTMPRYDGDTPTSGGNAQYSYRFIGWNPTTGAVVGDVDYEAIYEPVLNTYTVLWKNRDGTVLNTGENIPYGTTPTYGGEYPTRTGDAQFSYEFTGWSPNVGRIEGNTTYTAQYKATVNKYTITWKDGDGNTLKAEQVEYGKLPVYSGAEPTKTKTKQYTYIFSGSWTPALETVKGDATYTAEFNSIVNKYKVTWKNYNGDVLKEDNNIPYGETPVYSGVEPTKPGTAQHSYEFIGWEPDVGPIEGDTIYVAQFVAVSESYTVIWKNRDNEELERDENVPYGTMPSYNGDTPERASDTQYTYSFSGWNPDISEVTSDITYVATFKTEVNKYTITWENEDGTVLKTDYNVPYGTMPVYSGAVPVKTGNAQFSYEFTGWSPSVKVVQGNAVYRARYDEIINKYTVTWMDRDGTELETDPEVEYGTTPVYHGETPTKEGDIQYSYEFGGWDKEILEIHGDTTYTATYTQSVNEYEITWKDGDGNTLKTENVPYGETPVYSGAEPTKTRTQQYTYTFSGSWTPAIETVKGDATYTAEFNSIVNKYTIIWEDRNGTELEKDENVPYGTMPSYDGEIPTSGGNAQYSYTFAGWNPTTGMVTGDVTYTAQYKSILNEYEITWKDGDGNTLKTENVPYGETPVYSGAEPTKTRTQQYTYTFSGSWTPAIETVKGNATYTAEFNSTVNKYTINIVANVNSGSVSSGLVMIDYGTSIIASGNELKIGDMLVITATPNGRTPQYTHTFSGWNNTCGLTLTGGCTIESEFNSTINKYTITWLNSNGTELEKDGDVPYGDMPSYDGDTPTSGGNAQYSYTFAGWNPTTGMVTGDITYTATYTPLVNKYTITWFNSNGTVLEKDENVPYGTMPTYDKGIPASGGDAQYSYTFAGWDPATGMVIGNAEYTATYTQSVNKYKVKFVNDDGNILKDLVEYDYGTLWDNIEKPDEPLKPRTAQYTYTFAGWTPNIEKIIRDVTFKATYTTTVNKYTVIWENEDGTVLETGENIPYGTMPVYHGETPLKPGDGSGNYVFAGWDPTPTIVKGDITYIAKYNNKTVPDDGSSGKRRSGSGGRRHTSEETDQHGAAETGDVVDVDKEVFDAYKWAYKYGITTMDTEETANPDGYVVRGHLAKMVVNFSVNVLGRDMPLDTPTKCKRKDKSSEWESSEIKFYAEKSCAMGLMGIYTEEFMPNKIVDRAEFGTVVSRILWGERYNELDTDNNLYFTKHLKALQENGFMKDIDNPLGRKEFRKRVWVTLKRIELEKEK